MLQVMWLPSFSQSEWFISAESSNGMVKFFMTLTTGLNAEFNNGRDLDQPHITH